MVEQVYDGLHDTDNQLLKPYINRAPWNLDEFVAINEFNDNDIFVMDEIINFARHKTARDLVNITHGKNSLWKKAASEHNLLEDFAKKTLARTDYVIDF